MGLIILTYRSLSDIDLSTTANDPRPSASFSARKNPQRIPANTPPVFPGLRPRIWPHILRLVTKARSDRLLAPSPLPLAWASSVAFFLSGTLGSEAQCASEKWARGKRREARGLNVRSIPFLSPLASCPLPDIWVEHELRTFITIRCLRLRNSPWNDTFVAGSVPRRPCCPMGSSEKKVRRAPSNSMATARRSS